MFYTLLGYILLVVGIIIAGVALAEMERDQTNQEFRLNLDFDKGDILNLKIGGTGQVIQIRWTHSDKPYLVRIRTEQEVTEKWMSDFELEAP